MWRTSADVAWVEGEGRVALVDLRGPNSTLPQLCPEPAATLWRALAARPCTYDELLTVATETVGGGDAPALVAAFVEAFAAARLIVPAA